MVGPRRILIFQSLLPRRRLQRGDSSLLLRVPRRSFRHGLLDQDVGVYDLQPLRLRHGRHRGGPAGEGHAGHRQAKGTPARLGNVEEISGAGRVSMDRSNTADASGTLGNSSDSSGSGTGTMGFPSASSSGSGSGSGSGGSTGLPSSSSSGSGSGSRAIRSLVVTLIFLKHACSKSTSVTQHPLDLARLVVTHAPLTTRFWPASLALPPWSWSWS